MGFDKIVCRSCVNAEMLQRSISKLYIRTSY